MFGKKFSCRGLVIFLLKKEKKTSTLRQFRLKTQTTAIETRSSLPAICSWTTSGGSWWPLARVAWGCAIPRPHEPSKGPIEVTWPHQGLLRVTWPHAVLAWGNPRLGRSNSHVHLGLSDTSDYLRSLTRLAGNRLACQQDLALSAVLEQRRWTAVMRVKLKNERIGKDNFERKKLINLGSLPQMLKSLARPTFGWKDWKRFCKTPHVCHIKSGQGHSVAAGPLPPQ